ncbi:PucR family transcriptional regulator [Aeromicrobium sp. CF3.5]|uniref:PucR family transcriptional regulator n=1 Tax=Aeromicrobium sp. CF3.5 TaxID=3373078 RepID=UPI003EE502EF
MSSSANNVVAKAPDITDGSPWVTLREIIQIPCLAGTTVLAGAAGLDARVSRINVMEVPDVVDWVKPQELLVTTGYPLSSSTGTSTEQNSALLDLVRDLAGRQITGLGVKIGRYLEEIPADVLALADQLDFPLLGLPPQVAFDDLLQQAHHRLYNAQAAVLERIDALHEALARLVLEGGDLEQIAAEVARVLSVGVLLTSTDGRVQAEAATEQMHDALVAADLFSPDGRLRVERVPTESTPIGDGQILLRPIVAGGNDLARLVCFSPADVISSDDVHALERAATVAALLITRQQAVNVVESKYRGDFLRDVFGGRAGDNEYVLEHAEGLDWSFKLPAVVVSAEIDDAASSETAVSGPTKREWQRRFFTAWRQVLHAHDRRVPTADFSAEVVTLLPVPESFDDSDDHAQADVRQTLKRLITAVAGDRGGGRRPFTVGVSRVVRSLDDLPAAYGQSRRAVEVGRRVNGGGSTTHFNDLGIHRLMGLVPDPHELTAFAHDILGELADNSAESLELRTTLRVLLDCNLNVAEASRIQFFHYNTMRYRINKLERMLGTFTTDPNLRLNIAVALEVGDLRR